MKKFFALILSLVVVLSLCACSGTYTNESGETVEVEDGEVVLSVPTADYIITKIDVVATRTSNTYTDYTYMATVQSDEYIITINVGPEQYARWNVGDTISGELIGKYDASHVAIMANLIINDSSYSVRWYGKVE